MSNNFKFLITLNSQNTKIWYNLIHYDQIAMLLTFYKLLLRTNFHKKHFVLTKTILF